MKRSKEQRLRCLVLFSPCSVLTSSPRICCLCRKIIQETSFTNPPKMMESVPPLELWYQMLSHPCHMGPNPYFLVLFIWSSQNAQSCSICLSCLSPSSPAFPISLALQAHLPAALPSLQSLQSLYLTSVPPFKITLNTFTRKSLSLAQKRLCIFTMIAFYQGG